MACTRKIVGITYGMCVQQEQFMMLVQQPELGGFSLLWSDKLRKSVAKKNPKAFEALEKEFLKLRKKSNVILTCVIMCGKSLSLQIKATGLMPRIP